MKTYALEIFKDELIKSERWKPPGTAELNYIYPDESTIKVAQDSTQNAYDKEFFMEDILKNMETQDNPSAFGQHINAEITSQILDASQLLDDIVTLTPQKVTVEGKKPEEIIMEKIQDINSNIPEEMSLAQVRVRHIKDDSPLKIVLLQEISRYNGLLQFLRKSLDELEKGIKGETVISDENEIMMNSILDNKVPTAWAFAYQSVKPLANWI